MKYEYINNQYKYNYIYRLLDIATFKQVFITFNINNDICQFSVINNIIIPLPIIENMLNTIFIYLHIYNNIYIILKIMDWYGNLSMIHAFANNKLYDFYKNHILQLIQYNNQYDNFYIGLIQYKNILNDLNNLDELNIPLNKKQLIKSKIEYFYAQLKQLFNN